MDRQKKNMGAVAFLPLIVFLVCYVGCGITFTLLGADEPFGKFPRHVALLAGCAVALLLNRGIGVQDKLNIMTTSMGNSGVMMIVLIYLMAGGFQGAAAAMGGKDSVLSAFYSGETFGSGCIFDVLLYFYIDRNIHGNDCSDGSDCDQCGTGSAFKCCGSRCGSDRGILFWR